MRRLSLLLLLINVFSLFGIEYTVKQDGSGDYTTIQSAVNSAQSGDGILVYPGTYYENIIINEKNIDLYSLKHTTDDDSYIYQTTINGQDSLSCISIVHNCNVLIDGFSITNGNGWGSGFSDDYDYQGGGIKIDFDNQVEVNNCRIFSNQAMTGGGIFTRGYLTISNNSIFNNRGLSGGGIFIDNYGEADMNMSSTNRNSIYNNKAGNGLDIMYYAPSSNYTNTMSVYLDTFSVAEPDNYFITYQISNLSYTHNHNPFTIIDIEHGYRELINQDFYVSPQGDDNNSGLTPDDPLLSIYKAFTSIKSDSLNPKTVYLAEGEYSNIDGGEQIFPIPLKKHVNFQGANRENTVIYNESNYTGLKSNLFYENSTISNFTLTSITHNSSGFMLFTYKDVTVDNIIFENSVARVFTGFATIPSDYDFTIRNCIIRNNIATEYAAGLTIYYGNDLLIESCIIENNYSYLNEWCNNTCNGIYLLGGENLLMRKCIVRDNYVTYPMDWGMLGISGSLRYSQEHHYIVENSLFYNNHSISNPGFGQFYFRLDDNTGNNLGEINNCSFINNTDNKAFLLLKGNMTYRNSIFANNIDTGTEIFIKGSHGFGQISDIEVTNCIVTNGEDGIVQEYPDYHNLIVENLYDTDNFFFEWATDENADKLYTQSENSISIDNGTMDYDYPATDLAGNDRVWGDGIDIGCYEFGSSDINYDDIVVPQKIDVQNYPNPFNPKQARSTNIKLELPRRSYVEVAIFNIKGQKVAKILKGVFPKGEHNVNWDGRNSNNKVVASGQYFIKVMADSDCVVKKMLIVK